MRSSGLDLGAWRTAAVAALLAAPACNSDSGGSAFDTAGGGSAATDDPGGSGDDPTSSSAPATTANDAAGDSADDDDDDDVIRLDVGAPTGGFGSCECDLIYLWVADHRQGTVSKINTRTLVEEGRYLTRPDGKGNPSRTSVNLSGDVAVANRHGGLVKFYADPSRCEESNGIPGIQTSSGKDDVLSWEMEECRAWYTEFNATNQRPVAWTSGTITPGECDASTADVWTVTSAVPGLFPGLGGAGGVIAHLVDGTTGMVEEQVAVDDFPGGSYGAYGGAVDGAGNLYFSPLGMFGTSKLGRVDRSTLESTVYEMPQGVAPYGITVDHLGRVWVASTLGSLAARFDPASETWEVVEGLGGGSGLAEGPDDLMYISQGSTIIPVHIETLDKGSPWVATGSVKGVSFDADGYLWGVTYRDEEDPESYAAAYKIDISNMMTAGVYVDLDDPYTYSDMTGNALGSVACAPAG